MDIPLLIARLLLAAVFAASGLAKLTDRNGSRQALVGFGVPASLAVPLGVGLPVIELATAVALVLNATNRWGALVALALLLLFTVAIGVNLIRGHRPNCHCFGRLQPGPIGWATFLRNLMLSVISGLTLCQEWIPADWSAAVSLRDMATDDRAAFAFAMAFVLLGTVLTEGAIIFRLFVRLRLLKEKLAATTRPAVGLPIGVPAADFRLANLKNEIVTLSSLRASGKTVLLVFVDPECGPCAALLPDIARWQREHAAQLTIAIVSRGSPEDNLKRCVGYGLSNVLLQTDSEVAFNYRAFGTPSAVVVRLDGTTGSMLALGPEEITALVADVVSRARLGQLPSQPACEVGSSVPASGGNKLSPVSS